MSLTMIAVARLPDSLASSTNSPRAQRERLCAHRTGHPRPGGEPDEDALEQHAAGAHVGADDHEQHEGGDHDDDVGEQLQRLVEQPATPARDEAERHADGRGAGRAQRAHQVTLPQSRRELCEDIVPERVGAEPVLPRRPRAQLEEVDGVVRGDDRSDDGEQDKQDLQREAEHQLLVAQAVVEEVVPVRRPPAGSHRGGVLLDHCHTHAGAPACSAASAGRRW
jgi:hypothetical protein